MVGQARYKDRITYSTCRRYYVKSNDAGYIRRVRVYRDCYSYLYKNVPFNVPLLYLGFHFYSS